MYKLAVAILSILFSVIAFGAEQSNAMQGYDFEYTVDGHQSVRPGQVFDDGRKTYLQLQGNPRDFAIFSDGGKLLSGEMKEQFFVVDGVYSQIIVRQGRLVSRITKSASGQNKKPFGVFQLEEAEKEISSAIRQKNLAFDFEYEVLGNSAEKPKLIYNDGQATWIEISESMAVQNLPAKRSGPYWRIEGMPSLVRLSAGPKKPEVEIIYRGANHLKTQSDVVLASKSLNATQVTGSFSALNAAPKSVQPQPKVAVSTKQQASPVTGAFVVEVEKSGIKHQEPSKLEAKQPLGFDVLEIGGPVKAGPELLIRLGAFVEQHGREAQYQIGASSSERIVLEKQMRRLGVKKIAYSDEKFADAKILMIKGDIE